VSAAPATSVEEGAQEAEDAAEVAPAAQLVHAAAPPKL